MDLGKTFRWTLTGLAAALAIIFLAGLIVMRSAGFHHFMLVKIIQQAQDNTGTRIEIKSMDLRCSPLTADFYGVTVHGIERSSEPALLEADHLRVSLGIRELLRHKVDLYTIVLDRPVLHLRVSSDGRTNIPQSPHKAATSSNTTVLVQHAAIRDGLLNYNNEQIPLSAELDNFYARADFDPRTNMYAGSLGYQKGIVAASDMNAFEHGTQIDFAANHDGIVLNRVVLRSQKSRLTAYAKLTDYADPKIGGNYDGNVATSELARILKDPSFPAGDVSLRGRFDYRGQPNQPFLLGLHVTGEMSSRGLTVHTDQVSAALTAIHADYELQEANLFVSKIQAALLDGSLSASFAMKHLDKDASSQVKAQISGLSLVKLSDSLPSTARRNARLVGRLSANLQASWSKSIQRLVAHSHAEIQGPLAPTGRDGDIPVNGVMNVDYNGNQESASVARSQIRTSNIELTLSGTLSRQSQLQIEAEARDLHELNALMSAVAKANHRPNDPPAPEYDLRGAAHFAGQISGTPSDPHLKGQLSSSDLQIQGSTWRTVRANLDLSSSQFQLQNVLLENEQKGQIHLSARSGLQHWSFTPQSSVVLRGQIINFSIADVQHLANVNYPVTGQISGQFSIDGSEEHPGGNGKLELAEGSAWNEPIDSLTLEFRAVNDSVDSKVHLLVKAGAIDGHLNYAPKTQHYDVSLDMNGLKLGRIQSLQQRAGGLSGALTAALKGQGTIKDPQLSGNIKSPELTISGQKISDLDGQLNVARERAELELKSTVEQGYVHAKGGVDLTGEYSSNATADVSGLPLRPLLARFLPAVAQDFKGQAEIHASLKGPIKRPQQIDVTVELPTLHAEYKNLQLANDGPIRANYRSGVVTIEQAAVQGNGANLNVRGNVPLRSAAPMNVTAKGNVDLALLQAVSPNTEASGKIDMDMQASGSFSAPSMEGQVRVTNVSLSAEALPTAFSGINGEISVTGNRIDIKQMSGSAGGGTLSTHGAIVYGQQPTLNIDLQAKSVRIRPDGIRSVLDGNLQLNGTPQQSTLTGQVLVDRLSFQQGFDLATFLGQFSDTPQVRTPTPFENNMKLNVSVKSAQNLNPSSSQISMEGSADLNVTGTAADPVILGRIALTRGEVFFLNKRFEVDSGTVAFANPVRTEPVVNLFVKTSVEQYNITIHFTGPVEQLKTTYTSEPSLAQVDIINLLAFGQTTAERASNAATPTSLGAESALAQGVAGQVAKGVQSATGISQLTIDPLAGSSQNPGAQVAVQQRVTGSILLSFSTDVTSTQRQTVELQYQPKKQIKISVVRDEYGGYGIDVRLHKVF